jgi:hypothetical protein
MREATQVVLLQEHARATVHDSSASPFATHALRGSDLR